MVLHDMHFKPLRFHAKTKKNVQETTETDRNIAKTTNNQEIKKPKNLCGGFLHIQKPPRRDLFFWVSLFFVFFARFRGVFKVC